MTNTSATETSMEQTRTGASRPGATVPWKVGVAGPEAESAHSESEAPTRLWGASIGEVADFYRKAQKGAETLASLSDDEVDIATAPKQEILAVDKVRLYRYEPTAPQRVRTPLLIVYSQVGRYTMMDLQPDRSLVRNLLDAGVDVYMIDWGNPSRADQWIGFEDYDDYIRACVDTIDMTTGSDRVSLLGVCEGGLFAACFAALHPERVERLALSVTPIDFHADEVESDPEHGYINRWIRNLDASELESLVDACGHLPGELTGLMFQVMTPVKSLTKYTWDLPDAISGDRDSVRNFLRMEKWLSDRPNHPGAAAKQLLVDLYRENRLVKGEFRIDGTVVDLARLTMPVLNVYAERDHIVPPPTSRALAHYVGTDDYRELPLRAGHIGTFVSRRANRLFSDTLAAWLGEEGQAVAASDASIEERDRPPPRKTVHPETATVQRVA